MRNETWKLPTREEYKALTQGYDHYYGKPISVQFNDLLFLATRQEEEVMDKDADPYLDFWIVLRCKAPLKTTYMKKIYPGDKKGTLPYVSLLYQSEPILKRELPYETFCQSIQKSIREDVRYLCQKGFLDKETIEMPASDFWEKHEKDFWDIDNETEGQEKAILYEGILNGNIIFTEGPAFVHCHSIRDKNKDLILDLSFLRALPRDAHKLTSLVYDALHRNKRRSQNEVDAFLTDVYIANQKNL